VDVKRVDMIPIAADRTFRGRTGVDPSVETAKKGGTSGRPARHPQDRIMSTNPVRFATYSIPQPTPRTKRELPVNGVLQCRKKSI
jgi:hypothetical protein